MSPYAWRIALFVDLPFLNGQYGLAMMHNDGTTRGAYKIFGRLRLLWGW